MCSEDEAAKKLVAIVPRALRSDGLRLLLLFYHAHCWYLPMLLHDGAAKYCQWNACTSLVASWFEECRNM